jgi:hypothetical protein
MWEMKLEAIRKVKGEPSQSFNLITFIQITNTIKYIKAHSGELRVET